MSAPLRPAARTLTSTSPSLGAGSGCWSIARRWSRIVTARIAWTLSPLEQRHALNVRRLREHVDRPDPDQAVAGIDHLRGVRRERRGVAGHVHDPLGRGLEDPPDDLLREARAGGIDDHEVRPAR